MKSFVATLLLAVGADALVSRGQSCCFHLTGHGGPGGPLGQLGDGQNRLGGHYPEGQYCIDGNGGITDGHGRGCILTPPTTQFQCDVGAAPTTGFSVNCHGYLTHNGNSEFWGCPSGSGYNIYTKPVPGQDRCTKVTLSSDGCKPACHSGGHGGSCPKDLNGNYEFPHLIVPINSAAPNKAYGTSYRGKITGSVSTIFNFDIPAGDHGKKCSFVFKLPEKNRLVTSSYTYSGSGGISFAMLQSPANQGTTYNTAPGVKHAYGVTNVTPGHSYSIATFPCPGGQTIAFWAHSHGTHLNYFQDYNPPPIGAYVTVC